jgi:cytidylate kinase
MDNENLIVAIDGPSGTGKSISAQLLANKLGFRYIDSGSYYRAVTYFVLNNNIKLNDYLAICKAAQGIELKFTNETVTMNDVDMIKNFKRLDVTNKVCQISKIGALRRIITEKLVTLNDGETGMVMEGKDIGLTVFPKANFKFYLVSDMSARVARRHQDFLDFGQKIAKDKIEREIKLRDDMEIKKSPVILRKAENAIVVDTTNMIVEEQVNYLYRIITNPEADLIQP